MSIAGCVQNVSVLVAALVACWLFDNYWMLLLIALWLIPKEKE